MSIKTQETEAADRGELVRYLIIGLATTLLDWVITYILTRYTAITDMMLGTALVSTVAWLVATVFFAFWMYKFFVFRSRSLNKRTLLREFAEFVSARLLTWAVGFLIFFIVCDTVGFKEDVYINIKLLGIDINRSIKGGQTYIVKLGVCVINIIANYVFSKYIIFKKGHDVSLGEIERDEGED